MGILDALLGRSKPTQANLDRLFGLPGARVTLEASEAMDGTGSAGVCFKPVVGVAFDATERELTDLLGLKDGGDDTVTTIDQQTDEFGYRWIVVSASDFDSLVTRVHFVNSTLEENGYGQLLLCSVFGFGPKSDAATKPDASTYLVYLYKRGTFYPFVPLSGQRRDNEAELRLKEVLAEDLSIEKELDRWFPLWNLPVH